MNLKELSQFLEAPAKRQSYPPATLGRQICCLGDDTFHEKDLAGKYVILGFPDSRGVISSGKQGGAEEGPKAFRQSFYSLYDTQIREYNPITHHPFSPCQKKSAKPIYLSQKFVDAGDIDISGTLQETHEKVAVIVESFLRKGVETIFIIGGGHDFTYGSYKGHINYKQNEIVPIINFDANFNLRPTTGNVIDNQTAFYRILKDFPANIARGKALLEIGIQRERNPHEFYEFAEKHKISVVEHLPLLNLWRDLQEAHSQLPLEHIRDHIDDCAEYGFNRHTGTLHLSLSLDIFNQNIAPGSPSSTPVGIDLRDLSSSFVFFAKARGCRVFDLAELCPPLDLHHRTARLAATLAYDFALFREEYASR